MATPTKLGQHPIQAEIHIGSQGTISQIKYTDLREASSCNFMGYTTVENHQIQRGEKGTLELEHGCFSERSPGAPSHTDQRTWNQANRLWSELKTKIAASAKSSSWEKLSGTTSSILNITLPASNSHAAIGCIIMIAPASESLDIIACTSALLSLEMHQDVRTFLNGIWKAHGENVESVLQHVTSN